MRPIRTIMVTVSPLLKDLVLQAVAGQAALHVVSVMESRRGLNRRLPAIDADLVLIALRPDEDDAVAAELARLLPKCPASAPLRQNRRVEEGRISGSS